MSQKQISDYTAIKVFSATKMQDRDRLGETISLWLHQMREEHREFLIVDTVITQSSDSEFHCLAITIFFRTTRA